MNNGQEAKKLNHLEERMEFLITMIDGLEQRVLKKVDEIVEEKIEEKLEKDLKRLSKR